MAKTCCPSCCGCCSACTGKSKGGATPVCVGAPGSGQGKAMPQGTWLYIRFDGADAGARPIPSGDVFWSSPDIWTIGGDGLDNPIGGQPLTVQARIWNAGSLAASPLRVDFYYIAPSLGIVASAPKHFGTVWSVAPPRSGTIVSCPWTPPTEFYDLHACLIVTCSAPLQNERAVAPPNPVADRHTGQHNFTVIEAGGGEQLHIPLRLGNLLSRPAALTLTAAATWMKRATPKAGPFFHGAAMSGAVRAADTTERVTAQLWSRRAAILDQTRHGDQDIAVAQDHVTDIVGLTSMEMGGRRRSTTTLIEQPRIDEDAPFADLGNPIGFEPHQSATANFAITVPRKVEHPWLLVHIAQKTDGLIDGGYTVAIHFPRADPIRSEERTKRSAHGRRN
jgi:hypothetical protein